MNPLVSVVIPTHNRHDLLKQAVASVAAQTYPEVECIVIDDGSDEPAEAAARAGWMGRPSERLKVIRQNSSNGNVARNRGLDESNGEYIQFLDSDDLLDPRKLAIQVAHFSREKSIDAVISHELFFFEDISDCHALWNVDWWNSDYDYLDRFCWEETVWQTAGPLWNAVFLRKENIRWNERLRLLQDWEFHLCALNKNAKIYRHPECLVYLRDHKGPRVWSTVPKEDQLFNALTAFESIIHELKNTGKLTRARELSIERRIWFHLDRAGLLPINARREAQKIVTNLLFSLTTNSKRRGLIGILKVAVCFDFIWSLAARYYRRITLSDVNEASTWKKIAPPKWC